jgi:hypothetical protein
MACMCLTRFKKRRAEARQVDAVELLGYGATVAPGQVHGASASTVAGRAPQTGGQ